MVVFLGAPHPSASFPSLPSRSNEVWNPLFAGYGHSLEQARALGLDDGAATDRIAVARYHSQRSVEVFAVFQTEFGAAANRLQHVLSTWANDCGGHCGVPYTHELLMWGDAAQHVDALGVTGYFCGSLGGSRKDEARVMSVAEVVQACADEMPAHIEHATTFVDIATSYGVGVATYEAGPSISEYSAIADGTFSVPVTHHLHAVNRHPALRQVYVDYMAAFKAAGVPSVGAWMHFGSVGAYSQYGAWSFKEFSGQAPTPKYLALMDAAATASSVSPSGCLDRSLSYAGAGDAMHVGPPGVWRPRAGDVWVQGREVVVRYNVRGRDPSLPVVVRLHQTSNCAGAHGGRVVATLASGASATGVLRWRVPATTGHGDDFFVEVRDRSGANFSEPFSIVAPFYFAADDDGWSDCSAQCGVGFEARAVTCHPRRLAVYEAALRRATADLEAVHIRCPLASDCAQIAGQRDVRNQVCAVNDVVTEWPLLFSIDAAWRSMCTYDENKCRVYRTNFVGDTYGFSRGKAITDCTVTVDDTPLLVQDDVDAQVARRAPNRVCAAFAPTPTGARQCFDRPCAAFAWRPGTWSACSAPCGGGTRTRPLECIDHTNTVVDDASCAALEPLPTSEACATFPCDTYSWREGDFGECTATIGCGTGVARRFVACVSSLGTPVADSLCDAASRPQSSQACDAGACAAYAWKPRSWGECTVVCGGGNVSRTVDCVDTASSDVVDEYFCTATAGLQRPADTRDCNTRDCVVYGWAVDEWQSTCTAACTGSATRGVQCVDSTGAVVADTRCAGDKPAEEQACPCEGCALHSCSGHGSCDAASGVCTCTGGYHGPFCEVPGTCTGVLDADEACCASGVLDKSQACCSSGSPPKLDGRGECCATTVDACGVCGGSGQGLDVTGRCCPASSVFDASGLCCDDKLDPCGVCGGDATSCATNVVQSAGAPGALADLDPLSTEFLDFVNRLVDEFAALVGVDPLYVAIAGMQDAQPAAPGGSSRRRLATGDNATVVVTFTVSPGANSTQADGAVLTPDVVSQVLDAANSTADVTGAGVCGDGVCQSGETCLNGGDDSCCIADCDTVLLACPASSGGDMCGGTSRGLCLIASGQCDCFTGYTGSACEFCAAGWAASLTVSGTCVRADAVETEVSDGAGLGTMVVVGIAVGAGVLVGAGIAAVWAVTSKRRNAARGKFSKTSKVTRVSDAGEMHLSPLAAIQDRRRQAATAGAVAPQRPSSSGSNASAEDDRQYLSPSKRSRNKSKRSQRAGSRAIQVRPSPREDAVM